MVGRSAQVAVPISVVVPSSGMLLGLPSGRPNEKPPESPRKTHEAPLAPVASTTSAVCRDRGRIDAELDQAGHPVRRVLVHRGERVRRDVAIVREAGRHVVGWLEASQRMAARAGAVSAPRIGRCLVVGGGVDGAANCCDHEQRRAGCEESGEPGFAHGTPSPLLSRWDNTGGPCSPRPFAARGMPVARFHRALLPRGFCLAVAHPDVVPAQLRCCWRRTGRGCHGTGEDRLRTAWRCPR